MTPEETAALDALVAYKKAHKVVKSTLGLPAIAGFEDARKALDAATDALVEAREISQ